MNEVKIAILVLAEYYQKQLTENQVLMYAEDLSILSPEELSSSILSYRKNPKNKDFPIPARLIDIARPQENENDVGNETSSRIFGAIAGCGSYNPAGAKEIIGELGWEIVERMGGWHTLCMESNHDTAGTLRAQMRDFAQSIYRRHKAGFGNRPVGLPSPDSEKVKQITSQIAELMNASQLDKK